jgi:protein gp37
VTGDGREEPPGVDWVIVGGESGHGVRPMQLEWARSLVAQCKAVGTACFVKQLGAAASDPVNGLAGASLVSSRKRRRRS